MLKKFTMFLMATMMVMMLAILPTSSAFAATCNCTCHCTCNCGCNNCNTCKSGNSGSNATTAQAQPATKSAISEEAVKAETKRVTDKYMQEDNRRQYNGYQLQLANAFEASAKNSGFDVKTSSWAEIDGAGYTVVQQEFSKNNWTLKLQYRFGSSGFFDDCSPLWLYHNGVQITSGEDYYGWAWSSTQTVYELLDMISKL